MCLKVSVEMINKLLCSCYFLNCHCLFSIFVLEYISRPLYKVKTFNSLSPQMTNEPITWPKLDKLVHAKTTCSSWQRASEWGRKGDLCDSDHGTVATTSVSQTGIFCTQPYQGFTENEKKKIQWAAVVWRWIPFVLTSVVGGEWKGWINWLFTRHPFPLCGDPLW